MADNSSAITVNAPDLTPFQKKVTVTRISPTSGTTVTIPNAPGDQVFIIAPGFDLASLTVAWPTLPYDGQVVRILSTNNIASVTNTGAVLNKGMTYLQATEDINYVYDATGGAFMCDGVTLNNVSSVEFTALTAAGAGNAVFYATDSGLVGGNALFASIQDVTVKFDVADPTIAAAKAVISNGTKTITINCQKQTYNVITLLSTNILGSVTVGNAPNGVALTVIVHGILA